MQNYTVTTEIAKSGRKKGEPCPFESNQKYTLILQTTIKEEKQKQTRKTKKQKVDNEKICHFLLPSRSVKKNAFKALMSCIRLASHSLAIPILLLPVNT